MASIYLYYITTHSKMLPSMYVHEVQDANNFTTILLLTATIQLVPEIQKLQTTYKESPPKNYRIKTKRATVVNRSEAFLNIFLKMPGQRLGLFSIQRPNAVSCEARRGLPGKLMRRILRRIDPQFCIVIIFNRKVYRR